MGRRSRAMAEIQDALRRMEQVATHRQLRELGMPSSTIMDRIAVRGPWQRMAPGVVLAHCGTPTRREWLRAALAYAGEGAIITGADALAAAGLRDRPAQREIFVLTPARRQRASYDRLHLERTRRPPTPRVRAGIPYAPVARAVVDTCRRTEDLGFVRELVAAAVQRRLCTVDEIAAEIRAAARQRTALSRAAIAEISDGVRSAAEARVRELFQSHGIPMPEWNVELRTTDGELLLRPDGWWDDVCAALEIDSRRWHFSPEDWHRTQRRQRVLTRIGIPVLAYAPSEVFDDPDGFIREVLELRATAARLPRPDGVIVQRSHRAA